MLPLTITHCKTFETPLSFCYHICHLLGVITESRPPVSRVPCPQTLLKYHRFIAHYRSKFPEPNTPSPVFIDLSYERNYPLGGTAKHSHCSSVAHEVYRLHNLSKSQRRAAQRTADPCPPTAVCLTTAPPRNPAANPSASHVPHQSGTRQILDVWAKKSPPHIRGKGGSGCGTAASRRSDRGRAIRSSDRARRQARDPCRCTRTCSARIASH